MSNESVWYYLDRQNNKIAASTAELKSLRRSSKINPSTLVWTEGFPDWKPLATVSLPVEEQSLSQKEEKNMEKDWYVLDNTQKRQGPMPLKRISTLIISGKLNEESKFWCDGMPGWQSGAKVEVLSPHFVKRQITMDTQKAKLEQQAKDEAKKKKEEARRREKKKLPV